MADGELHILSGVRVALVKYLYFNEMYDELKPITKALYGLINEAIRECGLNEIESLVVENRFVNPHDEVTPMAACAEYLGVSESTVEKRSRSSIDKIHEYMNEVGADYYEQYDIYLQNGF